MKDEDELDSHQILNGAIDVAALYQRREVSEVVTHDILRMRDHCRLPDGRETEPEHPGSSPLCVNHALTERCRRAPSARHQDDHNLNHGEWRRATILDTYGAFRRVSLALGEVYWPQQAWEAQPFGAHTALRRTRMTSDLQRLGQQLINGFVESGEAVGLQVVAYVATTTALVHQE